VVRSEDADDVHADGAEEIGDEVRVGIQRTARGELVAGAEDESLDRRHCPILSRGVGRES
jgi:hypothetical protein